MPLVTFNGQGDLLEFLGVLTLPRYEQVEVPADLMHLLAGRADVAIEYRKGERKPKDEGGKVAEAKNEKGGGVDASTV